MRNILALLLVLVFLGCSRFDAKEMFTAHVVSAPPSAVNELKAGKASCLHCPIYFAFGADEELNNKIISKHNLKNVGEITNRIRQIEKLVMREATWWETMSVESNDKIYWVEYKPIKEGLERVFRLLVVKNNKSYFVTSGYFNHENYQAI